MNFFATCYSLVLVTQTSIKRLFDITFALIGLLALAPIIVIVGVLIKLDSARPVFYKGIRVGRFGKPFRMYKFRTMVANADQIGGVATAADDFRVTRVGQFLRKYNIDEIPQLINVLKGEMSLVGPRPEVEKHVNLYTQTERETILSVLPGMTDEASIRFNNEGEILRGSVDPEKSYMEKVWPEKMRLRMNYVRKFSLWNDAVILLKTLGLVWFTKSKRPTESGLG